MITDGRELPSYLVLSRCRHCPSTFHCDLKWHILLTGWGHFSFDLSFRATRQSQSLSRQLFQSQVFWITKENRLTECSLHLPLPLPGQSLKPLQQSEYPTKYQQLQHLRRRSPLLAFVCTLECVLPHVDIHKHSHSHTHMLTLCL